MTDARIGSTPVSRHSHHVAVATRMRNAPWAMLMMCMTPKMSVSPEAISAYTPPMRIPRTRAWTSCAINSLPTGLRVDDRLRRRHLGRRDDLHLVGLPLGEDELPARLAARRPAERAEDGLHL